MAVMQWKCSLLSPDKSAALHDWIDEQRALNDCPWAVESKVYGDDLVAENRHIQGLVLYHVLSRVRLLIWAAQSYQQSPVDDSDGDR